MARDDMACPKCGSTEWEVEADTQESVTYQVDFTRHVFTETNREVRHMDPTDWFCVSCHEVADDAMFERLSEEFVDEKSGQSWSLIEEDEWSLDRPTDEKQYEGAHNGCGVNMPHTHVVD